MDQQKLNTVILLAKMLTGMLKLVKRLLEIRKKRLQVHMNMVSAVAVASQHLREIQIFHHNQESRSHPYKRRLTRKMIPRNLGYWEDEVPKMTDDIFYETFRMDRPTFKYIVDMLTPDLKPHDYAKNIVSTEKKVAIALSVLLSEEKYRTVGATFGQGKSTVHNYFKDFIDSACLRLVPKHIKLPTHDQFKQHAREFEKKWDYIMAVGAVDGCHFKISVPDEHMSDYYNYREFYSVISIAVCDANYKAYYVKSGIPGSTNGDGGFQNTTFFNLAENGNLMPKVTRTVEGADVPFHVLGDSAFELKPWLMKPYPISNSMELDKHCFNMHHSRAQFVIKNLFGRLKARWRRLLNQLPVRIEDAGKIIQVAFALNNICEENGVPFSQQWITEAQDSMVGLNLSPAVTQDLNVGGKQIRDALKRHYFKKSGM